MKPLQVYIENVRDERIGGFTMPLPTTAAEIQPFLDGAEIGGLRDIKIVGIRSTGDDPLGAVLAGVSGKVTLDELNYLAARISELNPEDTDKFYAVVEAGWHSGSVAEIINITFPENLEKYCIQPAFTKEQYGEFLLTCDADSHADAIERLVASGDNALVSYIANLEDHIDRAAYAESQIQQERGVFTKYGYITASGQPEDLYQGIPCEYRLIPQTEKMFIKDIDATAVLIAVHALGGDFMRDADHNVQRILNGGDFLIRIHTDMTVVDRTDSVYRRDTPENAAWMSVAESPGLRTFLLSVTDFGVGNLYELDISSIQDSIRKYSFSFTYLDAEMKDGSQRRITREEWGGMDRLDRDQLINWTSFYDSADEAKLAAHLSGLRLACEDCLRPSSVEDFLAGINAVYMSRSNNPQPQMLRVALSVAKDMLVHGGTPVFRLTDKGAERLSPLDVVKTGLQYSAFREFAVRREDFPGIEKCSVRAAAKIMRQAERGERDKSNRAEL